MPANLFVDTNILVYLANENAPEHDAVIAQFEALAESRTLVISRQVLREYAVVMTRPGLLETPLTPDEVANDLEQWQEIFGVVDETRDVTAHLIVLLKTYAVQGTRIHDANLVAAMLTHGIAEIWTANSADFRQFKEIQVIGIAERGDAA